MRKIKQVAAALLAVATLALPALVAAAPPASAATVMCHTLHKHYAIGSGLVGIHVAFTDFYVEACTNSESLTTSAASTSVDTTSSGELTGFHITFHTPYRTSFSTGGSWVNGYFGYTATGTLRQCIPKTTLLCSLGYNYHEHAHIDLLSAMNWNGSASYIYIQPGYFWLNHRLFHYTFTHYSDIPNGVRFW